MKHIAVTADGQPVLTDREATPREMLTAAGFPDAVLDMADVARGDKDECTVSTGDEMGLIAAEWFVRFLAEQQGRIRTELKLRDWRA